MSFHLFLTFSLLSLYIASVEPQFNWGPDSDKPKPPRSDHSQEKQKSSTQNKNYVKYPSKCKIKECEYIANWFYDRKSDSVMFTIIAKINRGQWAGIGFSKSKNSPLTDLVTGYLSKDRYHFLLDDRHTELMKPNETVVDKQQNAVLISHLYQDGKLMYKFSRKRFTGDKYDKSFQMCVYFKFTWGGTFHSNTTLWNEEKTFFSKNKICIGEISPADPCKKTYCKENSHCVHNGHRSKCICNSGYSMVNGYCEKPATTTPAPKSYKENPCLKLYCKQHEYCVKLDEGAECKCKPGYTCIDEMRSGLEKDLLEIYKGRKR